jgi:hypothetical protein
MTRRCIALCFAWALMLLSFSAQALELAGVRLDARTRVGATELQLNGAGIRSRFFIKVYVAALYLPTRQTQAAEAIQGRGPKRVQLHLLREVPIDHFLEGLRKGLDQNLGEAELDALKPRLEAFNRLITSLGKAHEGDVLTLDDTDAGLVLSLNGKVQGIPIPGPELHRALLKVWLGDKPVQDDLKRGLLGGSA